MIKSKSIKSNVIYEDGFFMGEKDIKIYYKSYEVEDSEEVIVISHGFCENLIIVSLPIILSMLNGNLISISYMASFERLFSLVAHISFALFAFYAVKHKNLIYLILGILLHALSDSLIFILSNIYIMESAFALISIASFIAIIYIISKDKNVSKYDDIKLFI